MTSESASPTTAHQSHRTEMLAGPAASDTIPVGDSAPQASWPLWLVVGVWVGWLMFLVTMMIVRMNTTPI